MSPLFKKKTLWDSWMNGIVESGGRAGIYKLQLYQRLATDSGEMQRRQWKNLKRIFLLIVVFYTFSSPNTEFSKMQTSVSTLQSSTESNVSLSENLKMVLQSKNHQGNSKNQFRTNSFLLPSMVCVIGRSQRWRISKNSLG